MGKFWSNSTASGRRACCVTAPLSWTGLTSRPTRLCWLPAAPISAPSSSIRRMWCTLTSATQQVGCYKHTLSSSSEMNNSTVAHNQTSRIVDYGRRLGSGPRVHLHGQAQSEPTESGRCPDRCQLPTDAGNCECLLCVPVSGHPVRVADCTGLCCR